MKLAKFQLLPSLIGVTLFAGCTMQKISTATFSKAGTGEHQERQGLSIEVETVSDKAKLRKLFGTDNLGKGILAVHIQVDNSSDGKSFIVRPESFRLSTGTYSQIRVNTDAGQTVAVIGSIPISFPVMIVGLSMQANASVVRNNLMRREFKSATLQRGDSVEGFLFFHVPEKQEEFGIVLDVAVTEAGSGVPVEYQFNINR